MNKCSFFLILLTFPVLLCSQNQTTLAILEFDALGVAKSESTIITGRLRNELFKTKKFVILEREKMKEILDEQGFQLSGCITDECVIEVGKILGVQQMIAGSIGKVSRVFTITARLIDVETSQILEVANYDYEGDLSNLLTKGIRIVAFNLSKGNVQYDNSNNKNIITKKIQENTVIDIDGNVYKTVKIGDQWWMAENLKVTKYRNGEPIPNIANNSEWKNQTKGAYSNYENNAAYGEAYGRLYNWYAIDDIRSIAPEGWHVPVETEWEQLAEYLGRSSSYNWSKTYKGGGLKEAGTGHWRAPNIGSTNETGFSALPGGLRYSDGSFDNLGKHGYFWQSSGGMILLYYEKSDLVKSVISVPKTTGFSVRCIRD